MREKNPLSRESSFRTSNDTHCSGHSIDSSSITCNNCGKRPAGSRTVCMDCTRLTVNLCSTSECVNSTFTLDAVDGKPHLPNHGMFKVYWFIFDRDIGRIGRTARNTLNSARGIISQLRGGKNPLPMCLRCKSPVSLPCWCCANCTGEWPTQ